MKNAQGDVLQIRSKWGTTLVEYEYDAWGNCSIVYTHSAYGSFGEINPIRYRSYFYDFETGFYYLQSRYYDPAIRRFISADAYVSTGQGFIGCNMFAYCNNNPIRWYDPTGTRLSSTEIHNSVIKDIASRYVNIRYDKTYMKYKTIFKTHLYGYCDFYNIQTGEIWEVKRFGGGITCSILSATIQLNNYVNNGYLVYNSTLNLKIGGCETVIDPNAFWLNDKDGEGGYWVYYWYSGSGIIFYDYIYLASQKEIEQAATIAITAVLLGITLVAWSSGIPLPPAIPVA